MLHAHAQAICTQTARQSLQCFKVAPTEVEHSILEDLRNRVQLSSIVLPSVSFYTFINTHNGLNCSSISADGSFVAGGFSDSSLKVWDMAKLGQQTGSCEKSQTTIFRTDRSMNYQYLSLFFSVTLAIQSIVGQILH
ncbi:unnamed protein product [Ilex paraguariensis]|uniref:Transcription initiation factor TFIID subunit 5 n=1 Tax=Ilex paraguariensis TaxID=185542 RepID=A0ABC8R894_9AQUA